MGDLKKMRSPIFVDHLCYFLGEEVQTVEQSAEAKRLLSQAAALREAGFHRHHFCGPKTTSYDLARQMVESIRGALPRTGAVVYATSLPLNGNIGNTEEARITRDVKYLMDFPASHLQADFNLEGAFIVGVSQQACTSLLGAIRLGQMMLTADETLSKVLCLTADRFPEGMLYEQAYNLISDGAAGCLLSREPSGFRFIAGHGITNGAMAFASDDETIGNYFTYSYRLIHETLTKADLKLDDIRWIVSQNINHVTWKVLTSLLKIDRERVLHPSMPEAGHVISGDNIINLKMAMELGRISSGDKILLPMAGYGLNWQCLILEKV
jgi:3-oxoacyl-[acyl-carrier-protein] synthase III